MRPVIRIVGALVVAALAVSAALLVPHLVDERRAEARAQDAVASEPGDRARDIIATFSSGTHLYIASEMQGLLTDAQARAVEEAAAASDPAVYIALAGSHLEAGYRLPNRLADQVAAEAGTEGVFLVWDGEPHGGVSSNSEGLSGYVGGQLTGKKDQALLRYIQEVKTSVEPGGKTDDERSSDYWGGTVGAIIAGILLVLLGYPALVLVIGLIRTLAGYSFWLPGRWRDFARTDA